MGAGSAPPKKKRRGRARIDGSSKVQNRKSCSPISRSGPFSGWFVLQGGKEGAKKAVSARRKTRISSPHPFWKKKIAVREGDFRSSNPQRRQGGEERPINGNQRKEGLLGRPAETHRLLPRQGKKGKRSHYSIAATESKATCRKGTVLSRKKDSPP